ncbi:MAG: glutamate--tRNA ligase [Polyangiaceae bacterium]|nr:glutamate--tRNA ligase [Polyangiaceae bacterium]
MATPRVRFAPSPSGYLHIGGARTALFSWLWARGQGGQFILRVEDTDQERSSVDSVAAVLDGMKWLGLDWDEGPEVGGPNGPYFQSERRVLYREKTDELIAKGHAYRCYCTKAELDAQREALKAKDPKAKFRYPGTCRDRSDTPDIPHVVRFKVPSSGRTEFKDLVFGVVSTPNDAQQDFVIVRPDGFPLYNLACVVDDHEMGITVVARGKDHIGNTPQQIMMYEALGWDVPDFAHLPLMLSSKGDKLSKRHAAVGVQDYRDRGFTPDGVLNYLARFGWSYGDQEIFTREELQKYFSWDRVGKADGKFDERKFADVAFEHLKRPELTGDDAYIAGTLRFLEKRGFESPSADLVARALSTIRDRAKSFEDAAWHLDFYFRDEPEMDAKASKKFLKPDNAQHLEGFHEIVADCDWDAEILEKAVTDWVAETGVKMKLVAQPARVALTGRSASPGLYDVMVLLGKERSLSRVLAGIEIAKQAGG